jgi:predicted deacylase
VYRYGDPMARPKCYLQASIHAGETPAMMAAHHLLSLLDEADARGDVLGQIVIVPYANPIGLSQVFNFSLTGRCDLAGGGNFNRNWPDLAAMAAPRLEGRLTDEADANRDIIRAVLAEAVAEMPAQNEFDSLRKLLVSLAHDADLVFDTHCDDDALLHCFIIPQNWPDAQDFAAELGLRAILTEEDSGGGSFDEVYSTLWTRLAARFPEHPIPVACTSTTLELRGYPDVSDEMGRQDGAALFRTLQRRGYVAGDPGPLPEAAAGPTPLTATDLVKAPTAGVLAYAVGLGAEVEEGQVIAEIIDPASQERTPVVTRTKGFVLSRRTHKWVTPGFSIAKIVGEEELSGREGYLLES